MKYYCVSGIPLQFILIGFVWHARLTFNPNIQHRRDSQKTSDITYMFHAEKILNGRLFTTGFTALFIPLI